MRRPHLVLLTIAASIQLSTRVTAAHVLAAKTGLSAHGTFIAASRVNTYANTRRAGIHTSHSPLSTTATHMSASPQPAPSQEQQPTDGSTTDQSSGDKQQQLRVVMKGGEDEKAADFANYFCSYASLYHQKQMLTDHRRMQAYYGAIMENKEVFAGKRVLDVGTGSGILALWCAKAGAAKVFAVEYTDMAKHARKLVTANGVGDIVEVIQSSVEDLQLDGPVDIIISEWMGYFLLRESMMDSVVRARDKWLKPGGLMFPSHATMYWGLVSDEEDRVAKQQDYLQSTQEWHRFKRETRQYYDCDMTVLEEVYEKEQKDYYIFSSFWAELRPEQCVGEAAMMKAFDMHTCTLEDVQGVEETKYSIRADEDARVSGFAGWFTADFRGREEQQLQHQITLSTGPENGYTHWGQQVFYLEVPHWVPRGGSVEGTLALVRQKENIRLYDVIIKHRRLGNSDEPNLGPLQEATYNMP